MVTYIDIHTHNKNIGDTKFLYNLCNNEIPNFQYCSYGIHPWELGKLSTHNYFDKLTLYCQQRLIIAIGEIGIDRTIEFPVSEQIKYFELQHTIAENHNLPVIIHCVKAWSDFLAIRTQLKTNLPWIFHGYNGNDLTAQQLVSKGCYLSFGQQILTSAKVQEVFKHIPINKLFLETDDSQEKIENIYQKAADLRHICIIDLKKQLEENFNAVFKVL